MPLMRALERGGGDYAIACIGQANSYFSIPVYYTVLFIQAVHILGAGCMDAGYY